MRPLAVISVRTLRVFRFASRTDLERASNSPRWNSSQSPDSAPPHSQLRVLMPFGSVSRFFGASCHSSRSGAERVVGEAQVLHDRAAAVEALREVESGPVLENRTRAPVAGAKMAAPLASDQPVARPSIAGRNAFATSVPLLRDSARGDRT